MTTDELLTRLGSRGLSVVLGEDGQPRLKGPPTAVTPALRKVLKWHRDAIVGRLTAPAVVTPPLDRAEFRARLERFWVESGWTPLGGWKPGERNRGS